MKSIFNQIKDHPIMAPHLLVKGMWIAHRLGVQYQGHWFDGKSMEFCCLRTGGNFTATCIETATTKLHSLRNAMGDR